MSEEWSEREKSSDKKEDDKRGGPGWYSICANAKLAVSLSLGIRLLGTHAK